LEHSRQLFGLNAESLANLLGAQALFALSYESDDVSELLADRFERATRQTSRLSRGTGVRASLSTRARKGPTAQTSIDPRLGAQLIERREPDDIDDGIGK
jgi:hypothetical protein